MLQIPSCIAVVAVAMVVVAMVAVAVVVVAMMVIKQLTRQAKQAKHYNAYGALSFEGCRMRQRVAGMQALFQMQSCGA